MRHRAFGALLLILVATPIPALFAVCMLEACPMDMAPAMGDSGCRGITDAAIRGAALTVLMPDCCVSAAAQDDAVAVPTTAPDAPLPAPVEHAAPTLAPRLSPTFASACDSLPPKPSRPLYTLHSTLLI